MPHGRSLSGYAKSHPMKNPRPPFAVSNLRRALVRPLAFASLCMLLGACDLDTLPPATTADGGAPMDPLTLEVPSVVRIPRGYSTPLPVRVVGTAAAVMGPIRLEVVEAPEGVTGNVVTLEAPTTITDLTVVARVYARTGGPFPLRVRATNPATGMTLAEVETRLVVRGEPGELDPYYGAGPFDAVDASPEPNDYVMSSIVDSQRRLVVCGAGSSGARRVAFLVRFAASGAPDPTFGLEGQADLQTTLNSACVAVLERGDSLVVIKADYDKYATGESPHVFRLRATDGGLIGAANGTNPFVVDRDALRLEPFGAGFLVEGRTTVAYDVRGQRDGSFVRSDTLSLGDLVPAANGGFFAEAYGPRGAIGLARLHADGSVDTAFGTDGVAYFQAPEGATDAVSVSVLGLPDGGAALLLDWQIGAPDFSHRLCLTRFTPAGTLDTTFARTGSLVVAPTGAVGGLHLDGQNRIVVRYAVPGATLYTYVSRIARFDLQGKVTLGSDAAPYVAMPEGASPRLYDALTDSLVGTGTDPSGKLRAVRVWL